MPDVRRVMELSRLQNFSTKSSSLTGLVLAFLLAVTGIAPAHAAGLKAGTAKVDITNREAGPVNDPLFAKALVISDGTIQLAIVTIDAVAIAEIGSIKNDYLAQVRARLQQDLQWNPDHLLVNASHCHGIVCADIVERTVEAVKAAAAQLVPVTVATGRGHEDRIMENRRLKLKNGREADVRHAYSVAADADVSDVGPIDPEIGLLRLDRDDGSTLAVVYNFACHPIQGVPSGGNTADLIGYASRVLETGFGPHCLALFLQGCGGDINPIRYKDVDQPRDAEPLGSKLGLSAMQAAKELKCQSTDTLKCVNRMVKLARADNAERIAAAEAEQLRLLGTLKGTSLNFKTALPLIVKQGVNQEFPSYYSHQYLLERKLGREGLDRLDAENRRNIQQYLANIAVMEELTRLQTNLALLRKHQARNVAAGSRTVDVEVLGVRIGDFRLVTFPGELTVQIGLNIKQRAPHPHTFVAGYTNGYIYYAPTADQLRNVGGAQEDSDCILAPEWQAVYEAAVADLLKDL